METKFERVEAPAHPNAGGFIAKETHPVPQPAPPIPAGPTAPLAAPPSSTLDVVLPDGRVVVMARPEVACQFMVYRILAGVSDGGNVLQGLNVTVKALMYIQSIAGVKVIRPYDHVQAQAMMNTLGDEGVEIVASAYLQHFLLQRDALPLSAR